MDQEFGILESACRLTRISVGTIRSEREANQLIAWANASLRLAYASGEHELSYDTSEMKRTALEIRDIAQRYLVHNKCSDIVGLCNLLAGQLGAMCDAVCPDLSIYLQSRIRLGTY